MMLEKQLDRTLALLEKHKENPAHLEKHYDSILETLMQGLRAPPPSNTDKLIELIEAFDPWPLRWHKHIAWLGILDQGIALAIEHKSFHHLFQFWYSRAKIFFFSGQFENAQESIEQAIQIATAHHFSEELLNAHILEYDIIGFSEQGKSQKELWPLLEILLDEQKKHLRPMAHASLKGQMLLRKGNLIRFQGHHDKALAIMQNGFDLIMENASDDLALLARTYKYRASLNEELGNYSQSIADNKIMNAYFNLLGDRFSEIDSLGDLGLIYWRTGKYIEAEEILQRSIQMAEETKAQWWLVRQLGNQGLVQFTRGNLSTAAALIKRQKKLSQLTGNIPEEKRAISNGAFVKLFQGQTKEATHDLLENLGYIKERKYHIAEGLVYANLAWSLEEQKEATEYAEEALKIAESMNSPRLKIIALRALAELKNEPQEKQKIAQEALELAKKHNRFLNQAGALLSLATCTSNAQTVSLQEEATCILQSLGAENWINVENSSNQRLPLLL